MHIYSRYKSTGEGGGPECSECKTKVYKQKGDKNCPKCGKKINWN